MDSTSDRDSDCSGYQASSSDLQNGIPEPLKTKMLKTVHSF